MLTGEQVRAARALARVDQVKLADLAKVSVLTVQRVEATAGPIKARTQTEAALRDAFAGLGVEFLDAADGKGPGVRLSKP